MGSISNCFEWMMNQEGQSPCVVAQEVGELCNQEYTVSTANFQESSYTPNSTTANGCTCSWSIYNLLSACSYCVGQFQYTSWSRWITSCGSYASSDSYLPSGLSLSQGIPFWATKNPSTWDNAVFNITQAADIAEQDKADVTGGPLSTPTATTTTTTTTMASSSSKVSAGPIVGGVIGGMVVLIIGGLLIFLAVRRRRRQRTPTVDTRVPSSDAPQLVTVPSTSRRDAHVPSRRVAPNLTSPTHSTTNLVPTRPIPSGFPSSRYNVRQQPIADGMVTPFFATSPTHLTNRENASSPSSKAADAERMAAPPQRVRLNPPPYSAATVSGSSVVASALLRRLPTEKERNQDRSASRTTMYSAHSGTSAGESATTAYTDSRMERSRAYAAALGIGTEQGTNSAVPVADGLDGVNGINGSGGSLW